MKRILLFFMLYSQAFAQNNVYEPRNAIGFYGFGYKGNTSKGFAGLLLDFKLKDKKRLEFSTSATFFQIKKVEPNQLTLNSFALTSGLSWDFKMNKLHLIPGVQLGYLYWDHVHFGNFFYKFNGVGALAKLDFYYRINRISIGARYSCMVSVGREYINTPYVSEPYIDGYSRKAMVEYGISLRYHF